MIKMLNLILHIFTINNDFEIYSENDELILENNSFFVKYLTNSQLLQLEVII